MGSPRPPSSPTGSHSSSPPAANTSGRAGREPTDCAVTTQGACKVGRFASNLTVAACHTTSREPGRVQVFPGPAVRTPGCKPPARPCGGDWGSQRTRRLWSLFVLRGNGGQKRPGCQWNPLRAIGQPSRPRALSAHSVCPKRAPDAGSPCLPLFSQQHRQLDGCRVGAAWSPSSVCTAWQWRRHEAGVRRPAGSVSPHCEQSWRPLDRARVPHGRGP